MLHALEVIATFCTTVFAGAALYINVAEHPARMALDTASAAKQWAPSYRRATWMQAPLAVVGFVASIAAWFLGGGIAWLVAAVLIDAVVPFTFFGIMPTNISCWRALLDKWARLRAIRSAHGLVAALLCTSLLGRP